MGKAPPCPVGHASRRECLSAGLTAIALWALRSAQSHFFSDLFKMLHIN